MGRKKKFAFFNIKHMLPLSLRPENNRYKGSLRIILLKLPIFLLTACSLQMMHTTVSTISFHYSCCYKEMLHEKNVLGVSFTRSP